MVNKRDNSLEMDSNGKYRGPIQRKFRDWVDDSGLTQKQIAEASGMPKPTISKLVKGRKKLTANDLEKISNGLGIEPSEILGGIFLGRHNIETTEKLKTIFLSDDEDANYHPD